MKWIKETFLKKGLKIIKKISFQLLTSLTDWKRFQIQWTRTRETSKMLRGLLFFAHSNLLYGCPNIWLYYNRMVGSKIPCCCVGTIYRARNLKNTSYIWSTLYICGFQLKACSRKESLLFVIDRVTMTTFWYYSVCFTDNWINFIVTSCFMGCLWPIRTTYNKNRTTVIWCYTSRIKYLDSGWPLVLELFLNLILFLI